MRFFDGFASVLCGFFLRSDVELCVGSNCACDKALRFFLHLFFIVDALSFFDCGDDCVHHYAKDERGCDGSDGDGFVNSSVFGEMIRDLDCKSADARDEYRGNREEILVVAKVDVFEHFETADCDETVERQAHTAHHASGDGLQKSHKRADEGQDDAHHCRREYGGYGSVFGDCDATDGLTVSGVGADTEHGARDGAYAVAEKSAAESGFAFDKVLADDGAEVLVICDVFCKDDERHGHEREHHFTDARPSERCGDSARCGLHRFADVAGDKLFDCFDESKVGISKEGLHFVACACGSVGERSKVVDKGLPVDYLEIFNVKAISENREERSHDVACADADDKRNETSHLELLLS